MWDELEAHAESLDRLARQLTGYSLNVAPGHQKSALTLTVPLARTDGRFGLKWKGRRFGYRLITPDRRALAADLREDRVDVGVFLMLSELAAR